MKLTKPQLRALQAVSESDVDSLYYHARFDGLLDQLDDASKNIAVTATNRAEAAEAALEVAREALDDCSVMGIADCLDCKETRRVANAALAKLPPRRTT